MVAVVRTRVARTRFTMGLAVALFAAGVGPVAHAASIETIAKQAILVDITSNTVLFEKSPDQRMAPSSMSKIMTMYMVFDAIKEGRLTLESTLPVSERAWRMQGSKMFVELHNNIKVDDLIKGVIVQSGNDACIVFAEGLAGSESAFAERMNKRARELGLKDTNLTNATGWPDPNHYMTARDLSILAEHLIKDFPEYYHYYSIREFKYHGINQGNRNPLLYRGMDVDGMKTGHTEAGGYGLTASAEREGRRLILVVNGLPSMQARADESARLIEWGFREFATYALFKAGETVDQVPLWLGAQDTVPVTVPEDMKVTMARADRSGMKVSLVSNAPVAAPVKKGDVVGKVVVSAPGFPGKEFPVVAAQDVEKLGFVGRALAAAKFLIFGAS
ncbi:D-alanyl-D-alanine carboxypeptidase [Azospirillum brasilense]|uniref:serine-type D-Ala-D-Ala carboxypeptidase n=1 Tax=Azospirillum brasilense TaxID=192 RepID=A0A0P0E9Y5_AZOBR|nr:MULTISPECIES: D-alanyl-D-alanine carboxypeptidase family protein [Azospirillum]ALJ35333.1 D-alanyl-D-alanine carboxypeptidase [Azospirillum brasilense]MDW7555126.1 D-alanyl-D-alanine carboxypeptidase family protein [Azospirillum brasilense]MDW7594903.1 D-alanyl-D-alanine carboxypeptidase family protein [Azospirillum brasilense]MDW7629882.1 D-alanyl-D-alanine carboxypeptidase family protein [Azospirillum brasilense]MDX5954041.1 D-alanyl-D-alanine carboxypeptidase family protein [Azospirillum